MKRIILILSIFLYACTQQEVVVIDGCQYIKTTTFDGQSFAPHESLTHKGNCFNPIHSYNQPDTLRHEAN